MKSKLYHILTTLTVLLACASCNKDLDYELYKKAVSFAQNGLQDIHIRYKTGGKVTYRLPVVVSGSQMIGQDYHVKVAVDRDTLDVMNFERFRYRDDLYYHYLENNFYTFPAEVCIPAGQSTSTLDIEFSLSGINMVNRWVLPLTIVDDPGYETNHRKHYRKALLNIIPYNDYSGRYSATTGYVYNKALGGLEDGSPQYIANRELYVVDENTVFFYAGLTEEELEGRELYKIEAKFQMNETPNENGSYDGTVTLSAPHADEIGFKFVSGTANIRTEMDATSLYLEHKYITLDLQYEYSYQIPNSTAKIDYIFKGTMTLQRDRNIYIPDEDQAIYW